jgi:hypothetical protein
MAIQHQRETNIHTVHVNGVPASVSDQKGAIYLFCDQKYIGKRIHLRGWENETWGYSTHPTFQQYRYNGTYGGYIVASRLTPGKYYMDSTNVPGMYSTEIVVSSNWAEVVPV